MGAFAARVLRHLVEFSGRFGYWKRPTPVTGRQCKGVQGCLNVGVALLIVVIMMRDGSRLWGRFTDGIATKVEPSVAFEQQFASPFFANGMDKWGTREGQPIVATRCIARLSQGIHGLLCCNIMAQASFGLC